ncbi:fumarylacetoacetate hydrolase family protein [Streptomyces himalayensis]|uniref:Fumarylacetoacetate hydrolase family protein n=1 Tax=Streptomyces himalayensis subsp. himalayensis TaxID=2756131 RepID=A0A7W0DKX6_9ACTN|nr:fumarylacetoacetate hydrolase family protein [Streptomyces himalayensis]MBA2946840.1 fumarylacetoacetate hydrolase family protein [Streptomyces himalayensis subsp. himalayensis]
MTSTSKDIHQATGLREGTFGIATLAQGDRVFPALVKPNADVVDVSHRFHDTHAIFDDWERAFDELLRIAEEVEAHLHLGDLRILPPLARPNVLCAGANNRTHSAQMLTKNAFNQHNRLEGESDEEFFHRNFALMEKRAKEGVPFLWTSLHSALTGADADVVLPPLGEQHDWELEIAGVIGRSGRYVSREEAKQMIAGYTIVDDLGSVDVFRRTDIPWGYDWISKHQPTFKPTGPFIVPAAFVEMDDSVRISLSVNGEVMQDWRVNDWIFDMATLVAYASERVRLTPGDLLLAGSPPGNGMHHGGRFLKDGDVIDSSITGLGRQRNTCVREDIGDRTPAIGHWPAQ